MSATLEAGSHNGSPAPTDPSDSDLSTKSYDIDVQLSAWLGWQQLFRTRGLDGLTPIGWTGASAQLTSLRATSFEFATSSLTSEVGATGLSSSHNMNFPQATLRQWRPDAIDDFISADEDTR